MRAYYFSNNDKKLRYNDNRLIEVGITHEVTFPYTFECKTYDKPTLCYAGVHGSIRAIDALTYITGEFLWIVDIEGDVDEGNDKICGRRRTYLAGFDATELLKSFAKKVALINIEKIKTYCKEEDYDIILRFLNGDESLGIVALAAAKAAYIIAEKSNWFDESAVWATKAVSVADNPDYCIAYMVWTTVRCVIKSAYSVTAIEEQMNDILEDMIEEELKRN